ncbi:hypothetical protein LXA43DRAFT_511652 [Ganoderma leucocontextum]|nr:hypothetical protein LXA43DRAFT_511652 [Ganoderma leucocontextum]
MASSFSPSLGVYAAVRMNPTAMVAHLDARAMEEALEIRPKTYLVLTAFGLSLPFPGRDWYVYNVYPVGPSLRAVDEKRGFESSMCVPIFPNESHPAGRTSVRPNGPFPYDNCYHWAAMALDVRVHAREEGFDNTRAIRLSVGEQMDMEELLGPDLGRAKRTRLACEQVVSAPPAHVSTPESSPPSPSDLTNDATAPDEVDIFEPPEDFRDPEYIPLVHLWLDLPAGLKQEDIGNPVNLYKERFAIMSIIRRAHTRNPDLPTLREYIALQQDPYVGDSDSESYMSGTASGYASEDDELEPSDGSVCKPKRFRPAKLLRKLGTSVRRVLCIPI